MTLSACGPREAGPLLEDEGRITYWAVTSSSSDKAGCTDSPDFADNLEAAGFGDGFIGSHLIYKVEDGGDKATGQDCDTTDAATCNDDDAWVFDVQGHSLNLVAAPVVSPV
ncbi:MAG: hypothetical protein GY822_07890 [Deltaproteobacteria bacterium]|nr:hypothetical protein [Deltaproteobacteria bacterium]